ncbi:MgtC family membrane protein [Caballeronia udeis]|uniref:MgtC family membrane protein n=1 Tax=Caballeronia udeis TaxID=1232866 RepID=A0A158GIK3_9BURK|nr:MgtC family membrane protein [Caballeronia udeis]
MDAAPSSHHRTLIRSKSTHVGNVELISRLVLAAALGSVIGFERERLSWAGSVRVKQFVVQQSDDSPDPDEVQVELSRVSSNEYEAICTRLRALETVREFKEEGPA